MRFVEANSSFVKNLIKSPSYYKVAGLDIGTKYCGVAISDETRVFIGPGKDILRKHRRLSIEDIQSVSKELTKLTHEHRIKLFVIGLPVYQGKLTPLCKEIIDLMMRVKVMKPRIISPYIPLSTSILLKSKQNPIIDVTSSTVVDPCNTTTQQQDEVEDNDIACTFVNEDGSTVEARAMCKRLSSKLTVFKKQKDGLAASIILNSFLEPFHQP